VAYGAAVKSTSKKKNGSVKPLEIFSTEENLLEILHQQKFFLNDFTPP